MSLGVFPSERAFTVGGDVTQVGPFWVIFDRGSEHCARPTSASPQKQTSGSNEKLVANGMDRPRSRPRQHSECAGGLSGEGAPSCLTRPAFTQ
jgi:hypothetical protein